MYLQAEWKNVWVLIGWPADLDLHYSNTCVKRPLTKRPKIGFQDQLSLNAGHKYCRMLKGSILQYFRPSLSYQLSLRILFCLFLSVRPLYDLLCFFSVLCLLCLCARLFICALWSPAGKGLTSWLSFVVSSCEFVTFPLVSWVRCGT